MTHVGSKRQFFIKIRDRFIRWFRKNVPGLKKEKAAYDSLEEVEDKTIPRALGELLGRPATLSNLRSRCQGRLEDVGLEPEQSP